MDNLVVGIGEVLWDILPEGKKIGGAPANFAYHVSQLGLPGVVVSAVGADELGREILDVFDSKKLNYFIEVLDSPTGTVNVELDNNGIPCYQIKEDVAWDNIPFTKRLEDIARLTRAVCFGSLAQRNEMSRNTIRRFLDAMPESDDRLVIFDVNLRQNFYTKEILRDSMQRCNVLKLNDEELVEISEMFELTSDDFNAQCRAILNLYNLRMLILTCGVEGSYVFTSEMVSYQPTPVVDVADTLGAGDSFTTAFISSILQGKAVAEAHAKAVQVAAFVCAHEGAMPVLPSQLTD